MSTVSVPIIRVQMHPRGSWQIVLPDRVSPMSCENLHDARRLAYLHAARGCPCEIVICDAYHHVIADDVLPGCRQRD